MHMKKDVLELNKPQLETKADKRKESRKKDKNTTEMNLSLFRSCLYKLLFQVQHENIEQL